MFNYSLVVLISSLISPYITHVQSVAGGRQALLGDVPWHVQVRYKPSSFGNTTSYLCGGVLVLSPLGTQVVLTSGNCVTKTPPSTTLLNPSQLFVVAGRVYFDGGYKYEVTMAVTKVARHPDWRRANVLWHDIAVLQLSFSFEVNRLIQPLFLPTYTDVRPEPGLPLIISGWGFTGPHVHALSVRLIYSSIQVVSQKDCNEAYRYIKGADAIPNSCFCAGKIRNPKYQGMCDGDQGGAGVTVQNNSLYVAGIFSWTQPKCGNRFQPNVYANVADYVRWIFIAAKP